MPLVRYLQSSKLVKDTLVVWYVELYSTVDNIKPCAVYRSTVQ